jgi:hypothetical protein
MRNWEQKNLELESREATAIIARGGLERRRVVRFQLQAPVILEWIDFSGFRQESVGRTCDISIFGAFVTCGVTPPRETLVSLEVQLPSLERNTFQGLRLKASGKVTRAGENEEGIGIAVSARFLLQEAVPECGLAGLA